MDYKIWGNTCQAVTISLNKGESLYTHEGGMSWMSGGMEMLQTGAKGIRFVAPKVFSSEYRATEDNQEITFSTTVTGEIVVFDIKPGYEIIAQDSLLLCAEKNVDAKKYTSNVTSQSLNQQGFLYQQYFGSGKVFLEMRGLTMVKELAAGETLICETANAAAWETSVHQETSFSEKIQSQLFDGKGTMVTTFVGPGKVWLQTAPIMELAKRILPYTE